MSSVEPIGVCVIGSGRAGMIHGRNFASGRIPGAKLRAVVDPDATRRRQSCQDLGIPIAFSGYQDAISDPKIDAVIVATPTRFHCEIAVAAARAGKHVLCEKPMAIDSAECNQMIEAADRARVKLQIGFMRRFDANFTDAKRRLDTGEIGRAVLVKSLTYGPSTPKPWMYDLRQSNGPLAEVNSHDIDTLRWFAGSEFEEVFAVGGNFRARDARQSHPDFYDNVVLVARFANGMQGTLSGAQGVQYGYDARCEVLGERGLITVGRLADRCVKTHTARGSVTPVVRSWMDLFLDAYRAEDEAFVRCIRENQPPRVTGNDGQQVVRVVTAGNRSIAESRPVPLTEIP